jgi:hypothetical protein
MKKDLERFDLVYLECWQQAVSAIEDSELLEAALGGPDTSVRIRNMRRVKINIDIGEADCEKAWQKQIQSWKDNHMGYLNQENELVRDVKLKVNFLTDPNTDNLCSPSVNGGYLGAENQTIRVQLTDKDHFTWGFDNASPLYRVLVTDGTITFLTAIKDQHHWPLSGQVVEILPWSAVLPNGEKIAEITGFLSKVDTSYDPDTRKIIIKNPIPASFGIAWKNRPDKKYLLNQEPPEYYYLRVWDRGNDLSSTESIPFVAGAPVKLGNTGLAVSITGDERICSDYWVIAARPNTSDQVIPWRLEVNASPNGVRRYYAPLAILHWHDYGKRVVGHILHDCRKRFRPLTDLKSCCTFTVGDEVHSRGDFDSIEKAMENLPMAGGKICVLPGEHHANLIVFERSNIQIEGCGERSIILPDPGQTSKPIFHFNSCQKIEISNLSFIAHDGIAIEVADQRNAKESSSEIHIHDNHILAKIHAIKVFVKEDMPGENDVRIVNNTIGMLDKDGGLAAIFCLADGVLIKANRIVVVSKPDLSNPGESRKPDDPIISVFDPCHKVMAFYQQGFPLRLFVKSFFGYVRSHMIPTYKIGYVAMGGIALAGTSENVSIVENVITGGYGNGITMGHLPNDIPVEEEDGLKDDYKESLSHKVVYVKKFKSKKIRDQFAKEFKNTLYNISIEGNQIRHMGLSGIGVVAFFSLKEVGLFVSIEQLKVVNNSIISCAQQIPAKLPESMLNELGFGGIVLTSAWDCVIKSNRIENNGVNQFDPISGICILLGDRIAISDNHILNNGPKIVSDNLRIRKGVRGGIVIGMAAKLTRNLFSNSNQIPDLDNVPVARIYHNLVLQPVGQALLLTGMGPMAISDNSFISQGINKSNSIYTIAGVLLVINLGISKDIKLPVEPKLLDLLKTMPPTHRNFTENNTTGTNTNINSNEFYLFLNENPRILLPSGDTLFANNLCSFDLTDEEVDRCLSAQMVISLDDIAYTNNLCECTSNSARGRKIQDTISINTILLGLTIKSCNNSFREGLSLTKISLLSLGVINRTSCNIATHCIFTFGLFSSIEDQINFHFPYYDVNRKWSDCDILFERIMAYLQTSEPDPEDQLPYILHSSAVKIEQQRKVKFDYVVQLSKSRTNGLKIEANRLKYKYGSNYIQVKKAEDNIAYNKLYQADIEKEIASI